MRKSIPISEVKNLKLSNYQLIDVNKTISTIEEINKFYPCYGECEVSLNDDKSYYFEYTKMFLKNDLCKIQIRYDSYRKKYSIFLNENFSKLTSYRISEIQNTFKAPNNIGVLSTKKLTDWVNYCQVVYKTLKEENEKLTDKVQAFLKTLENENVRWFNTSFEVKEGEIIRGGLVYKFKIDQGSITQEIKINYLTDNTLNMFKKLSNNELLREQKINKLNDR